MKHCGPMTVCIVAALPNRCPSRLSKFYRSDLDHIADDGNDERGGYIAGIQRGASAAGKTRCSGALGPPEVSTPLSINAETMRCALRSDVPVAMSTSPRGISPPR